MTAPALLLALIPAISLFGLGLWLLWPTLCRRQKEKALLRTLHNLGPEVQRDVVLENGIDGLTFIDFVVLTPNGAVAVEFIPRQGAIFGAENADQWSQVVGRKTTRFPNPISRNQDQVNALRLNAPDLKPRGLVLFGPDATFPKGKPDNVVIPNDLHTDNPPTAVPATLNQHWKAFVRLAQERAASYPRELALLREKPNWGRPILGTLSTLGAIAWAGFSFI